MKHSRKTWIVAWTVFAVGMLMYFVGPPLTRFILDLRAGHGYEEFEAGSEHRIGSHSCFVTVPVKHGSFFASYNRPMLPEYFSTPYTLFYDVEQPMLWALAIAREDLVASAQWPALPESCVEAMSRFVAAGGGAEARLLADGIAAESLETVLVAAEKNYLFISHGLLDEQSLLTMARSLRCE
ncbi:MAG: hypothetical protein ACTS27_00865 [Phycisphaerales bacterium]